jgi:hypothetical protein
VSVPPRREPPAPDLSPADLALCAFGPWHPEAQIVDTTRALHDPRCKTERLADLWARHETQIRAHWADHAAHRRASGWLDEPWVENRLWFVAIVRRLGGSPPPP